MVSIKEIIMKKCIVVMCAMLFLLLPASGCLETFALIGGGAAGGMTISQKLEQQRQIIRDDIAMMEAEKTGDNKEILAHDNKNT